MGESRGGLGHALGARLDDILVSVLGHCNAGDLDGGGGGGLKAGVGSARCEQYNPPHNLLHTLTMAFPVAVLVVGARNNQLGEAPPSSTNSRPNMNFDPELICMDIDMVEGRNGMGREERVSRAIT